MKKTKKALALFLIFCMMLAHLPVMAFAVDVDGYYQPVDNEIHNVMDDMASSYVGFADPDWEEQDFAPAAAMQSFGAEVDLSAYITELELEVVRIVNRERIAVGSLPLGVFPRIQQAARGVRKRHPCIGATSVPTALILLQC